MHEMTSADKYAFFLVAVVILAIGVFRLDHLFQRPKPVRRRPPSAVSRTWIIEELHEDATQHADDDTELAPANRDTTETDHVGDYLRDIATRLSRNASDAKADISNASPRDRSFLEGRLLAYNEVLSLLATRAVAFGIDPDAAGLKASDPDQEFY